MLCFLCCAEGSAANRTEGSAAFQEKQPPLAAGKSLQHDRDGFSARRMPLKRTETSFQSKLGVLLEKPGWALQGISVETDPKPSRTTGSRQKSPSPSRCKVPAHGGTRPGHSPLCPSSGSAAAAGLRCPARGSQTFVSALNQVALSDTFVIGFNSRKSVFALEERKRT